MSSLIRRAMPLSFPAVTQSPFLFAVYHLDNYPAGKEDMSIGASTKGHNMGSDFGHPDGWNMYHGQRVPGFPNHPHRGFETVTVIRHGVVDHSDSMGCAARFSDGDTQWMTAGKGITHCEMFPQLNTDKPNLSKFYQIWINLPARSKFVEPHFKMLWGENAVDYDFPSEDGSAGQAHVTTVAGTLPKRSDGLGGKVPESPPPKSWAADPDNHVAIWVIRIDPGATWTLPAGPSFVTRSLFFYHGPKLEISSEGGADKKVFTSHTNLQLVPDKGVVLRNPEHGTVKDAGIELLLLQGRPIDEPVVQHGPFVMNTRAEIMDAFQDYQAGKFGRWPWKSDAPVHPKTKGRFARYADGREELPPSKGATKTTEAAAAPVAASGSGAGAGAGAGSAAAAEAEL